MQTREVPVALRNVLVDALDAVADGLIVFDDALRVLYFNRGAEQLFGRSASAMVGQPLESLLPPHLLPIHRERIAAFAASPDVATRMGKPMQLQITRPDGASVPAEADVTKLAGLDRQLFLVTIRDMRHHLEAERALQESEERYRSIVAVMEEGVVLQLADGTIAACNASAQRILGLCSDEMSGRTSFDPRWQAIHEDGSPFSGEDHPAMVTLRTGQPQSDVIMGVRRSDGSLAWISINSQALCRPDEVMPFAVVTSFSDITGRRHAEEKLRESEERYHSLFENSLDGILLSAPDGRVFAANPAACAILGRSEEEICQAGRAGLLDPSDARWVDAVRRRAETGSFCGELDFLGPDGSRIACDVSSSMFEDREGQPRAVVIFRDVSARNEAEGALRQQEALLRKILEILPVGVWSLDSEGRVQWTNEAGRRIWAGARYVGMQEYGEYKAWWPGTGLPVRPEEWAAARAVTTGEPVIEEQVDIEAFDGSRKTILNSALPILDGDGAVIGAIAINQDITERAQAFQLLEQRVEERTRELRALLETSRNIAATLELGPLLASLLTQLKTVIDYGGAGVAIRESDGVLRMVDYVGEVPREKMLVAIPLERDSGYRQVVLSREPFIIDDIWGDEEWIRGVRGQWPGPSLSEEVRSWLGVPLVAKGRLIGVLRLDHSQPGYFTQEHARLALAFADQAAAAIENARLYEQAQQVAVLEERQRLARELHDSVSQALYGMTLGTRTARALVSQDTARATEALDYVLSLTEAAFAEMRALIFELRPDSLAEEGLVAALTRQAELMRARHHLLVETEFSGEPDLPLGAKTALYRITQEALNNIVKHARAARVGLRLAHEDGGILLQVQDDGIGFDPNGAFPGHLGLRSMRERAEALGGRVEVGSRPEGGSVVSARIPLVRSE
jgi:PAS domain S-box-containing protein